MTIKIIPPTERRCPDCEPGVDWRDEFDYCPNHGKSIRPLLVKVCECGYPEAAYKFCPKCGRPVK